MYASVKQDMSGLAMISCARQNICSSITSRNGIELCPALLPEYEAQTEAGDACTITNNEDGMEAPCNVQCAAGYQSGSEMTSVPVTCDHAAYPDPTQTAYSDLDCQRTVLFIL